VRGDVIRLVAEQHLAILEADAGGPEPMAEPPGVNALANKGKFNIKDSNGKVVGSMTGKEIKAVWNGTSFTVTKKNFDNGGAGGGTGGPRRAPKLPQLRPPETPSPLRL
jgi:hypothetical protein